MKRMVTAAAAAALILSGSGVARAAEVGEGLSISGFVDTAYYSETNTETSAFTLDQVEVDVEKSVEGVGGLRLDIQHLNGDESTGDSVMEQGYVYADFGVATLTFGKFNAPIGFELLDPNEMYQYSHAFVFTYGLPTNLVGAMVSGEAGMIDYAVYVVDGWDSNGDANKDKTFGGRLGITPMEGANIGLSYISGKEGDEGSTGSLTVFDVDASFTAIEGLTLGAEFNSGTAEGQSAVTAGDDATWTGFLVMANYGFTDAVALTVRYDSFHDAEGARLGSGMDETRSAITVSPSLAIGDGMGVLAEYKYTTSDQEVFTDKDGASKDNQSELAVEFTYSF